MLSSWRHHYIKRVGIFLAVVAFIAATVGCEPPLYELTIHSTEGGSVITPGEGTFIYAGPGNVVELVAEPDEGYEFIRWTGDVKTIDDVHATRTTITMNGDYSITASFQEIPPPINWPLIGGAIAAAVVVAVGFGIFFTRRRRKASTGKGVTSLKSDDDTKNLPTHKED